MWLENEDKCPDQIKQRAVKQVDDSRLLADDMTPKNIIHHRRHTHIRTDVERHTCVYAKKERKERRTVFKKREREEEKKTNYDRFKYNHWISISDL